jgi:hypothetical protein
LNEREKLQLEEDKTLTYGEVDFNSIVEIILFCKNLYGLKSESVFWDLGHGTGKVLVSAALSGQFSKVKGIELLYELWKESENLKVGYQFYCERDSSKNCEFQTILGDFLMNDWSDGDFILLNSTCY